MDAWTDGEKMDGGRMDGWMDGRTNLPEMLTFGFVLKSAVLYHPPSCC